MSTKFTRVDAFKVTVVSKDDGHCGIDSYFTNIDMATRRADKIGGSVLSHWLYKDEYNSLYELEARSVFADVPERQDVLAKLSAEERHALGLH